MNENMFDPVTMDIPVKDIYNRACIEHLAIDQEGDQMLGVLFKAQGTGPHPTAIILHGFPGHERNLDIAHALRRGGWNSVIFHYRGSWGSGGTFRFSHMVPDLLAVIEQLKDRSTELKVVTDDLVLIGHSMGGWTSMIAAANMPEIKKIAYIGGFDLGIIGDLVLENPVNREYVKKKFQELSVPLRIESVESLIEEVIKNRRNWRLKDRIDDLSKRSILMVGAKNDDISIPELHLHPLSREFDRMGAENIHIRILDSDHSFSDSRIELIRTIWNWISK